MEKDTLVTKFSALTTSTNLLEWSRKPDDQVNFISNYIDVYQRLKKFLQIWTYNAKLTVYRSYHLAWVPSKQRYNKDLNQPKYQLQYCNFHLVPPLDTFKKIYIFASDRVTPNFISVIHGNLNSS